MEHHVTEDGQTVMVMGGIPLWLFLAGIAGILVLSFVATEWIAPRARPGFRLDLTRTKRARRLVRSRWFQAVPQLFMVVVLGLLIYAGLAGSRIHNITPVAVWTLWWGGLIVAVLFTGASWCFVCPWDGLANLATRLRLAAKVETLSLKLRYPRWAENVYPAIGLFVLLTWLELGFGVTTNPRWTAYMGIGMASLAIVFALLWDGKRFCAHACPVGRICGIYGNVAPLEIRPRKMRTCEVCTTEDCLHGNKEGYPCPTGISMKTMREATMCTACTECIKSCDKQNIAIRLRPFGADLGKVSAPRRDVAWLSLMLLALTLFHGFSMTSAWESFRPGAQSILKWMGVTLGTPRAVNFTVAMAAAVALPILLYAWACKLGARLGGGRVSAGTLFVHHAYALLPVALFYHLAHNAMHLLHEGSAIVPLLSDPLGRGWDLFGTASMRPAPLVGDTALWHLQVGLILVGHIIGIVVAHRVGHDLYPGDRRAAARSLVPMLLLMVLISACGLGLMHLDMNMRVGRM